MKRTTSMAVMLAGLLAASTFPVASARAQTVRAPVGAAAYNWTGFYLGGGAGYGTNAYSTAWYTSDAQSWISSQAASQGAFLTAIAGYDWQLSQRIIAGVMVDGEIGGPQATLTAPGYGLPGPYRFRRDGAWSVGGRIGWLATPDTLFYVPGGYTQSRYSWQDTYFLTMSQPNPHSATAQGWFTGFGLETRLGGNWTARGEYRYAWLGDICVGSDPTQTTSICRGANDSARSVLRVEQLAEQSARVTLAYRFPGSGAGDGGPRSGTQSDAPRRWTGFYLGGGLGGGAFNDIVRAYGSQTGALYVASDGGGRGAFGTVQAGFDFKFAPQWVAGVFADVDWSRIGARQVLASGPYSSNGALTRDRGWSAGARLGFLATTNTLLYVPVGLTQSHYAWDGAYFSYSPVDTKTFATSLGGFFTGFGVETMFADHWSLRGEYRYAWLGGSACVGSVQIQTIAMCKGVNDGVDTVSRLENFTEQTARAVLSYRFN